MALQAYNPSHGEPEPKRARYELTPALSQALAVGIQGGQHFRKTGLEGPNIRLWGHTGEIFGCEFSPDGNHLASCSFDYKIFLWNVYDNVTPDENTNPGGHNNANYGVLSGHTNAVLDVCWSLDGSQIYSCSADKSCAIWDSETGSDDGSSRLWDLRIRRAIHSFDHQYQILSCCFDANCEKIFGGSLDDTIRAFDLRMIGRRDDEAEEELYVLEGHTDSITGLDLSPDGERLLSNSMDGTCRIWDVRSFVGNNDSEDTSGNPNRCLGSVSGHRHNYEKNLIRCKWSKFDNGEYFGVGSSDRQVYIWNSHNYQLTWKLPGHEGSVNCLSFHPKENIICSGSSDKTLFLGELGD